MLSAHALPQLAAAFLSLVSDFFQEIKSGRFLLEIFRKVTRTTMGWLRGVLKSRRARAQRFSLLAFSGEPLTALNVGQ